MLNYNKQVNVWLLYIIFCISISFSYFVIMLYAKIEPNILQKKYFIRYAVEIIKYLFKANVFTKKNGVCVFGS